MPNETKNAVNWAKDQHIEVDGIKVFAKRDGDIHHQLMVDFTRRYFNERKISYNTFNFGDIEPYI